LDSVSDSNHCVGQQLNPFMERLLRNGVNLLVGVDRIDEGAGGPSDLKETSDSAAHALGSPDLCTHKIS
jgi:hypothetical protein